jgi:IS5 family transposase
MAKRAYRVRNWKKYNEALVKRGSITFWFNEKAIKEWHRTEKTEHRGRPEKYSDIAIQCSLTIKAVFRMALRATEGFIRSLIERMKLPLKAPDYTTLCKRQKTLSIDLPKSRKEANEGLHIVIDTSGLKIFGEGEWRVRQHGKTQRRRWRKVHLAVNSETQEIEACCLTKQTTQDCEGLPMLLDEVNELVDTVIGDGAYDRFSCYEDAEKRKYRGIFPPQHNASTSKVRPENKKKASKEAVLKRDKAITECRELGRAEWKKQTGYHRRSLAETAVFRLKTLLNDRLSSRLIENQQKEFRIWCCILNKMTTLGMPQTVKK